MSRYSILFILFNQHSLQIFLHPDYFFKLVHPGNGERQNEWLSDSNGPDDLSAFDALEIERLCEVDCLNDVEVAIRNI